MKLKKLILGSLAITGSITLLTSCATLQTAQTTFPDDVYSTSEAPVMAERTTSDAQEEELYAEQNDNGAYSEGYYDGMSYANRISRFYYGTPGLPYYDPWVNHWDIYYTPFRSGFHFGWGGYYSPYSYWGGYYDPYYYGRPYYGGYYGGGYWGGGGYYGGGYYGGGYPVVSVRERSTRPSRLGTDNVVRSTRPSRGASDAAGRSAVSSRSGLRPTVGDRLERTRNTSAGNARPTTIERSTRSSISNGTRGQVSDGRISRPRQTDRQSPAARPAQQSRPQARPAPSRPASQPSISRPSSPSPSPSSRPSSGGSSGGSRPSRGNR